MRKPIPLEWLLILVGVLALCGAIWAGNAKGYYAPSWYHGAWKKDVGADQQIKVRYAWNLSHNMDFIYTIEMENGLWSPTRRSRPNSNGTRDFGICQINSYYHAKFIHSKAFKSYRNQLDYCWKIFQEHTNNFYAYAKRYMAKDKFKINP